MNNTGVHPIAVGSTHYFDGHAYTIKSIKPQLGDLVLEGKGGIELTKDLDDFYSAIADGRVIYPGERTEATGRAWSESEQMEADFRKGILDLMSRLYKKGHSQEKIDLEVDLYCQSHGRKRPSPRSIKTYRKSFACAGYAGLVPNFSSRGGTGWAVKKAAKSVAIDVLKKTFMKDDKVSLTSVTHMVNAALKEQGSGETLDRHTVGRCLMALPPEMVKGGRLDPRTCALYMRQAVKTYDVKLPFERVEIDAKTIDVYCVDEYGNRYTQLTLYAMVCACTSYPIAVYVTGGKPSEHTLLKLFEFAFSPKGQAFKELYGIETDWVRPCSIGTVVLDNATENASDLSMQIVRKLGINVEYARIARGDDKPHVESFFRSLDISLLHKMPGSKVSADKRVTNRHARAEKEACYSISDIYRSVVQFIADVYIHAPHETLSFKRHKASSIKSAMDESLLTYMPMPAPSVDEIKHLVLHLHRAERRVQHYGVDFEGFQYHSAEFAQLCRTQNVSTAEILYHPEDCKTIYALHPVDKSLIPLHLKIHGMPDVSFELAKQIRKSYKSGHEMTGHDYQAAYAQMLSRFTEDSQRKKKKISTNNQALRRQEKAGHKEAFHAEVEKVMPLPTKYQPSESVEDDDITPAPRKGLDL